MCGVWMETTVNMIWDWCVGSVRRYLYTSYQTDVWSLYGDICTQVVREMFGVCMETSLHQLSEWSLDSVWSHLYIQLSDWCEESVFRYLYTSYQTNVWSLYGDICTQDIRLMCGVCMDSSVLTLSDWCVKSVLTHLYTRYQIDVWSLYGDIYTPVVWLMCGVCMDTTVHKVSDWYLESLCMTSVHKLSDWCDEFVWTHLYTSCQIDVWSLHGHICTQDISLMCGVCLLTYVI
jgi:hypothetical protein